MDQDERQALAEERAERYAPAPTGGALMAGVCVAAVALGGDFLVSGFYGWSVGDQPLVAIAATILGFLVGFVGYKKLARTNRRATRAERRRIDAAQSGEKGDPRR